MKYKTYSYRFGEEIINSKLGLRKEIEWILDSLKTPIYKGAGPLIKRELKKYFLEKGWNYDVKITKELGLSIGFQKERVGVQAQMGNVARLYADLFKLQVMSYSNENSIDVGVLILPTSKVANTIGKGIANFEKVVRELPYYKSALSVPLWVIGLEG
jgi:hypothetical protein